MTTQIAYCLLCGDAREQQHPGFCNECAETTTPDTCACCGCGNTPERVCPTCTGWLDLLHPTPDSATYPAQGEW